MSASLFQGDDDEVMAPALQAEEWDAALAVSLQSQQYEECDDDDDNGIDNGFQYALLLSLRDKNEENVQPEREGTLNSARPSNSNRSARSENSVVDVGKDDPNCDETKQRAQPENSEDAEIRKYDPEDDEDNDDKKPAAKRKLSNSAHLFDWAHLTEGDQQRDAAFALSLQIQEVSQSYDNLDNDESVAIAHSQAEHEAAMNATFCGKAYKFVEAVVEAFRAKQLASSSNAIEMKPIAVDDMLPMVERCAEAQGIFRLEEKDTVVDIGYHYTRSDNLPSIQTTGLLTKCERQDKGIVNNYNGSTYGDGVYTGNNPHAFSGYGDTGILVARLKGNVQPATGRRRGFDNDTGIVCRGSPQEMVILGQSYQCIPLLQFRNHSAGSLCDDDNKTIWAFHCMLQAVVDQFFNNGISTGLDSTAPPADWSTVSVPTAISMATAIPAPTTVMVRSQTGYELWKKATSSWITEPPLPMNGSPCRSQVVTRCCVNDESVQPNETMRIRFYSQEKLACDNTGTIIVTYGIRKDQKLTKHCLEFLPDTADSTNLLERLKYAFMHGLLDDENNSQKLPQRTNPYQEGPANHVLQYHQVLDSCGVPPSGQCFIAKFPPESDPSVVQRVAE